MTHSPSLPDSQHGTEKIRWFERILEMPLAATCNATVSRPMRCLWDWLDPGLDNAMQEMDELSARKDLVHDRNEILSTIKRFFSLTI